MVWDPMNPKLPEEYAEFDLELRKLHSDWKIMEWNDSNVLEFIKNFYPDFLPTYLSYDIPVKKHDAARYLIVNHFGGVFIQHSIKLQKNIEPLIKNASLVVSKQNKDEFYLGNSFFASVPKHIFWKEFISKELVANASKEVLNATGPDILTLNVKNYLKDTNDSSILVLDHRHLYPFSWEEKNDPLIRKMCIEDNTACFELFPDSYGFCIWRGSWIKLFYH